MLMRTQRAIVEYGAWIGGLCLLGLAIFYFFPNAAPPANIDWAQYPGMEFLKKVDAAGNALISGDFSIPSLIFGSYTLTNNGNSDAFIKQLNGQYY